MTEKTLTVVLVEPMKKPEVREIPNTLQALQETVGGYIEAVYPFRDRVAIICNEEGKLRGLQPNRLLPDPAGRIVDVIFGTFLIVGLGDEEFISLNREQQGLYVNKFRQPQVFGRGLPRRYAEENNG